MPVWVPWLWARPATGCWPWRRRARACPEPRLELGDGVRLQPGCAPPMGPGWLRACILDRRAGRAAPARGCRCSACAVSATAFGQAFGPVAVTPPLLKAPDLTSGGAARSASARQEACGGHRQCCDLSLAAAPFVRFPGRSASIGFLRPMAAICGPGRLRRRDDGLVGTQAGTREGPLGRRALPSVPGSRTLAVPPVSRAGDGNLGRGARAFVGFGGILLRPGRPRCRFRGAMPAAGAEARPVGPLGHAPQGKSSGGAGRGVTLPPDPGLGVRVLSGTGDRT